MMRAILKMLFWFCYSIAIILLGAGCFIFYMLMEEKLFFYAALLAAGGSIIGIGKILSTKI